jgi:plastocyanin
MPRSSLVRILLLVCLGALAIPASAAALPGAQISAKKSKLVKRVEYPGIQHLHFDYGPIAIAPGQNDIEFHPNRLKPSVPGYITRFRPGLVYSGTHVVPRVDVIHLHHGVWLMKGYPTYAAGEEKTISQLPRGYGYHYDPGDNWIMNYMLHNLTPRPTRVTITYDIDFVPDSTAAAKGITPVHPLWMDVSGLRAYPVFNALKGEGKRGKFTFPDQARPSQQEDVGSAHEWVVPRDITLVGTAGHLHPGGLWDDLTATRGGKKRLLFRSVAKYFEPAGAVSWDVSMTATKPNWRVFLKAGDKVDVSTTYDTRNASWYEVMGIMPFFYADGKKPGAKDPFTSKIDTTGLLTHGHLAENRNHGGKAQRAIRDARTMPNGVFATDLFIKNFVYGLGDQNTPGKRGRPPVVRQGQSITFTNLDATPQISAQQSAYHTITACKAPCTGTTGIAYPIANGKVQFDSGELGYGPGFATPAENRNTWQTPKNLQPGTYTYFCRIHPFMRGSFRVVSDKKRSSRR